MPLAVPVCPDIVTLACRALALRRDRTRATVRGSPPAVNLPPHSVHRGGRDVLKDLGVLREGEGMGVSTSRVSMGTSTTTEPEGQSAHAL